ncbi:MAG: SDR family NAD(P)-dependent oxidoreductase [Chitinivibrionales bacterium]|nr:SDR family NAD(P)-dependent oxidoreductase [Chitinivibrionales bacterium]
MNILITGTSRGIGLALAKSFLSHGATVFATVRNPSSAASLQELQKAHDTALVIVPCDVSRDESVAECAEKTASQTDSLDILVNNAAIYPRPDNERLENIPFEKIMAAINTNTIGPMRTAKAFIPLLKKGNNPRIVNISSGAGSISKLMAPQPSYGYAISKAALNMATRSMAGDLKEYGITVTAVSPGWVRTDMGGPSAAISPEESATSITKTVLGLTMEKSSLWLNRQGHEAEWAW